MELSKGISRRVSVPLAFQVRNHSSGPKKRLLVLFPVDLLERRCQFGIACGPGGPLLARFAAGWWQVRIKAWQRSSGRGRPGAVDARFVQSGKEGSARARHPAP